MDSPESIASVYMSVYTRSEIVTLHIVQLLMAAISVLSGLLSLYLWFRMDPRRRMIFRLQFLLSLILWDFLKAVCYLVIGSGRLRNLNDLLDPTTSLDPRFCDGLGFVVAYCAYNADWIILFLAIHSAMVIFWPRLSHNYCRRVIRFRILFRNLWKVMKFEMKPTIDNVYFSGNTEVVYIKEGGIFRFRWPLAIFMYLVGVILCSSVFIGHGHYSPDLSCTVPSPHVWKRLINDYILKYINVISIVSIYTAIIIYLFLRFRKIRKEKEKIYNENIIPIDTFHLDANLQRELMGIASSRTKNNQEKQLRVAMKDLKTFMLYPLGYVFIWMPSIVSQIFFLYSNKPNPFGLRLMRVLTVPSGCLVDTIIFLVREKPWRCTTAKLKEKEGLFFVDREGYLENEAPDVTSEFSSNQTDLGLQKDIAAHSRAQQKDLSEDDSNEDNFDLMEFLNKGPMTQRPSV